MDGSARENAFAQLITGVRFERKRFQKDIDKFKGPLKSPTVKPQQPGAHLAKLNYFNDPESQSDAATTDLGSETGDPTNQTTSTVEKELPKPGKKKAILIRQEHTIKAAGDNMPPPITSFNEASSWYKIPEYLSRNLFSRGFKIPTKIQMQGIPCLLEGRDFIGVAPTGSGKTLAFLLPMLAKLKRSKQNGLRGLILSHSKELAMQSERELRYLSKGRDWKIQTMQSNKSKISQADILCTTPGRLTMFKEKHKLSLSNVEYVVFDEADQLFDTSHDNFFKVMEETLTGCAPNKQVVVLCATLPEKAEGIIRSFMTDPCRIMIGTRASASRNVDQRLVYCGKETGKMGAIRELIFKGIEPPVLLFVQSIERAKDLYNELQCLGQKVAAIHSDRAAAQRDQTVKDFRLGKINILVCTELLSRGVDFKGVGTVINYDFPMTIQSYVHRVGRTGRADRKGIAHTFWTDDDRPYLRGVAHIIKSAGGDVAEWMLTLPKRKPRHQQRPKSIKTDTTPSDLSKIPIRREPVSAIRKVVNAEAKIKRFKSLNKLKQKKNDPGKAKKKAKTEE